MVRYKYETPDGGNSAATIDNTANPPKFCREYLKSPETQDYNQTRNNWAAQRTIIRGRGRKLIKYLATLTKDDVRSMELANNSISCAEQALRPDAVPANLPEFMTKKYFHEALFAYADAKFLQKLLWQDLAECYSAPIEKLYLDFGTRKLFIAD